MVELNEKWKLKNSALPWVVVSVEKVATLKEKVVGLSGPGPARSVVYVTTDDLEDEWEKVD